jgi:uncharacterized membrane protein YfcA
VQADWYIFPLLVVSGALAGFVNTLTGSGSLVSLAMLVFAGLPANVANGTNRLGVLVQTLVGVGTFARKGRLHVPHSGWYVLPAIAGAIGGALLATDLDQALMETVLGVVMVLMLGIVLYKPKKWQRAESGAAQNKTWLNLAIFFAVGFYGGFIQAGIGIFLMVALVLGAQFNTQESTVLKMTIVLFLTVPSLAIFLWYGQVHWLYGGTMAVGQSVGAWAAARFALTNPRAALWTHRLLVVVVVLSILSLFGVFRWLANWWA